MRPRIPLVVSTLLLSPLLLSSGAQAMSAPCAGNAAPNFSDVLTCYKNEQDTQPLTYTRNGATAFAGVEKRSFKLSSQQWSPEDLVTPSLWQHDVDIYIPDNARGGQALLLANNGTLHRSADKDVSAPTDFTHDAALKIARETGTIVISVSNIPNQYLTWTDDGRARREDPSVAHSWRLFLDAPAQRPYVSLRLPMVVSMIKAMDLAEKELAPWAVDRFIASGVSKRGWTTWLTAIADDRVEAIVPFVIDILNMDDVLEHTWRSYGKRWPLAFHAYHEEGITGRIDSENFRHLMKIEDPLRYLDTPRAHRLAIPKYIVNASSDDFFLPDNATFFYDRLPGAKALRVAPNASHYGISRFIENSLIPVVNRWQQGMPLPEIEVRPDPQTPEARILQFSETPTQVTQWTAVNPQARDFRYPCGIRYEATELTATDARKARVLTTTPEHGWKATFVEATFSDGFTATTQVQVLPTNYPTQPPPSLGPTCQTLDSKEPA